MDSRSWNFYQNFSDYSLAGNQYQPGSSTACQPGYAYPYPSSGNFYHYIPAAPAPPGWQQPIYNSFSSERNEETRHSPQYINNELALQRRSETQIIKTEPYFCQSEQHCLAAAENASFNQTENNNDIYRDNAVTNQVKSEEEDETTESSLTKKFCNRQIKLEVVDTTETMTNEKNIPATSSVPPSSIIQFTKPKSLTEELCNRQVKLEVVDTTETQMKENNISKTSYVSPSSITKFTKPSTSGIKISDSVSLDTKDLTEKISNELKEHQISQTVFAKKVLGRSQGTFSELIKHPRPWELLHTVGRENYLKMNNWLVLPLKERLDMLGDYTTISSQNSKKYSQCRKRFFFTLVQKRTLEAFFKSHPNPSDEMKVAIAEQLELDLSQVSNFFFNSRRRIHYSKLGKQMNQSVSDDISKESV